MFGYIWDKLDNIINFMLENSIYFLFIGLVLNAYIQQDIHKQIISLVLAVGFLVLILKKELIELINNKIPVTDSPTPQNWVYAEVLVRGGGFEYWDYIIITQFMDYMNQIKELYKNEGKEVVDIKIRYVSRRI
jgi:hypothetical protein